VQFEKASQVENLFRFVNISIIMRIGREFNIYAMNSIVLHCELYTYNARLISQFNPGVSSHSRRRSHQTPADWTTASTKGR
jgi:hypothetical protein